MLKKRIPWVVLGITALILTLSLTVSATKAEPTSDSSKSNASRWQIHKVDYSYGDDSKVAKNSVLLDTVTGETWLLMASEKDDEQFYWQKIPKR